MHDRITDPDRDLEILGMKIIDEARRLHLEIGGPAPDEVIDDIDGELPVLDADPAYLLSRDFLLALEFALSSRCIRRQEHRDRLGALWRHTRRWLDLRDVRRLLKEG